MKFEITGKLNEEGIPAYNQHTITELISTGWTPKKTSTETKIISASDVSKDMELAEKIFLDHNSGYYISGHSKYMGM